DMPKLRIEIAATDQIEAKRVQSVYQRGERVLTLDDEATDETWRAGYTPVGGCHLSTNPGTRGSCGSTSKSVLATRCAVPAMIGTTPSAVSSSTRARKRVPMIDSWMSVCPGASSPEECSAAMRAAVPEPHGERST